MAALAVGGCEKREEGQPLVELPQVRPLCPEGYQLLLDFEVGGGEPYYCKKLSRPTWPGGESGVTIAIGYDLGYNTAPAILRDWKALPSVHQRRLSQASGVRGVVAKQTVPTLSDIEIGWSEAEAVFQQVSLVRFTALAKRTYPGFEQLHEKAQAALVSLTYNRGSGMVGERRRELREIRSCVAKQDYTGMAYWNRASTRIWKGTALEAGMTRRREAEAKLMESGGGR